MPPALSDDDARLDRRYRGGDLPVAAERALRAAGQDWQDEAASGGRLHDALALAPGHMTMQIAAYKFYLHRLGLTGALPSAQAYLAHTVRRNNPPADWRDARAGDAAFDSLGPEPRIFLFVLLANLYVLARLGRTEEALEALEMVAALNPADRMGARRLLAVLDRAGGAEDP